MSVRWQKLTELFETALAIPSKDREPWLRDHCSDAGLRGEVIQMLVAHEDGSTILDQTANDYAADLLKADSEDLSEITQIGNYRLLEEIASGGMGKVYLAERSDGQFEHRVAVKILRSALSASHLERRFLTERQILASLGHPNVARILDGGVTDSGAPYFAMEFVEGVPITEYCEQHGLSIRRRLELFLDVCAAVAHAHQRLVVHRDLKPSNIFVTAEGHVKLLDFGIAKVLESDLVPGGELHTMTGLHLMTPEYASPEQVRGEPISIASDIYQLGILLYELLSGQRPYELDSHSLTAIASAVLESEPRRPGTVVNLPSDLDAVTLKALRKEPEARYPSVDHLAADVRRYLDGKVVDAHKGSFGYRSTKFLKRYKWAVGAAGVFLAMLLGYAVTVTVHQSQTSRQRDRAERYAEFVTEMFASPDPLADGARLDQRDITVEEYLDQASSRLHAELGDDPALRMELLETVGMVYQNLGADDKARNMLGEALDLSNQIHGLESEKTLEIMRKLSWSTADDSIADSLYRLQLEIASRVEPGGGRQTGLSLTAFGDRLMSEGLLEEADSVLALALEPENWDNPETGHQAAGALLFRSRVQGQLGNVQMADSLARLAYEVIVARHGPDHARTAVYLHNLAAVTERRGDVDEAEEKKRRVLEIWSESLGEDHPYTIAAKNNLAITLDRNGDYDEARQFMREVLEARIRIDGEEAQSVAEARQNLGAGLLKQERLDEAEPLILQAHQGFLHHRPDHYATAFPLLSLTEIYLKQSRYLEAEESSTKAMDHFARTLPADHPLYAVAQSRNGAALIGLGRYREAKQQLDAAIEILASTDGYDNPLSAAQDWLEEIQRLDPTLSSL